MPDNRTIKELLRFFSGSQIVTIIDYSGMIPRPLVLRAQKNKLRNKIGEIENLTVLFSETSITTVFTKSGEEETFSQLYIYVSSEISPDIYDFEEF